MHCAGALIWHGRDLRRYKRLLSPPLQRLLTCPGTAALGRGVASMPASYAHQVPKALATLCLAPLLYCLLLQCCPFMVWAVALHLLFWLCPLVAFHPVCCATVQMGPGQSLMHLASDAVRAAAESPFLEEAVKKASAILCCISMPSPKQRFAGMLPPCMYATSCLGMPDSVCTTPMP